MTRSIKAEYDDWLIGRTFWSPEHPQANSVDESTLIGRTDETDFHIGRQTKMLTCKACGANRLIVGQSSEDMLTIIKCPSCAWEYCIHDG